MVSIRVPRPGGNQDGYPRRHANLHMHVARSLLLLLSVPSIGPRLALSFSAASHVIRKYFLLWREYSVSIQLFVPHDCPRPKFQQRIFIWQRNFLTIDKIHSTHSGLFSWVLVKRRTQFTR